MALTEAEIFVTGSNKETRNPEWLSLNYFV